VNANTGVVQGGAGWRKSQSFEPEKGIERPLLQSVRKVEENSSLQVFGGCHKEYVQESSLRLKVVRKLRKDKTFELLKAVLGVGAY
jgi:hypothetical protein